MRSDKNATVGSPAAAFAFVSDFNSCYKIAFEKQGVRPIPVWEALTKKIPTKNENSKFRPLFNPIVSFEYCSFSRIV